MRPAVQWIRDCICLLNAEYCEKLAKGSRQRYCFTSEGTDSGLHCSFIPRLCTARNGFPIGFSTTCIIPHRVRTAQRHDEQRRCPQYGINHHGRRLDRCQRHRVSARIAEIASKFSPHPAVPSWYRTILESCRGRMQWDSIPSLYMGKPSSSGSHGFS